MNVFYRSFCVATAMILWALAASTGLITQQAFDMGFYGLIAAAVVAIGSDRCRLARVN